jgi:hypothetical protein
MLRSLINTIGDQALVIAIMAVFAALMAGALGYVIVRDFGVEDEPSKPFEVQSERR